MPTILSGEFTIAHQDVIITVEGTYQESSDPIEGINVYLFTASGSYVSRSQVTDPGGQATFNLPEQSYKVRADYLGQQFWSETFTWMDVSVVIAHGLAHIHVTRSGADLDGADVYLFTESGSYLSRFQTTDTSGVVEFLIPAGSYKFRANQGGDQRWSAVTPITADLVTDVEIEMEEFPPTVTIVEPDGVDDIADTSYIIKWTDDDPDDNATISLFYDNDNTGEDGTLIVEGLSEDPDGPGNDEYVWDTSTIADGAYYVYAVIDDDQNDPVVDYSEGVVTIDHTSSIPGEVKLKASDAEVDDGFGYWADIDDDYTIVGSPWEDENGVDSGAAYIFKRNENAWTEHAKITAGDAQEGDLFGISVSIDGDYAIVGAGGHENDKGAAYVFRLEGAAWIEQAIITAGDAQEGDLFGSSVSIDGDYAIVGAGGDENYKGSAYIYRLEGAAWVEQAKLTASDGGEWSFFGSSVSICGEYAIIGARYANYGLGAAYIFRLDGDTWTEQAKLTAGGAEEGDFFGGSVSIDGDYAIVGADGDENEKGAAYIFRLEGSAWVEHARLTASDGEEYDYFGIPVAINGLSAIVGSSGDDDRGAESGAVYIYTIDEGTGPPSITVTEPDGIDDAAIVSFGIQWTDFDPDDDATISLYYDDNDADADGTLIVSGLSEDPDGEGNDEYVWDVSMLLDGTYYVYAVIEDGENDPVVDYSNGPITIDRQKMGLTPGTPSLGAQFGYSVDVDGSSIIVGAWGEENNTGSASIYNLYSGLNEQAKLTAGDGQEDDYFGYSVALSGDYAIVGAYGDDNLKGAAYVFKYDGSTWSEQAKIVSGDGAEYDYFGYSVAMSGDYAVVGALYADEGAGASYIFRREGTTWAQEAKLTASDGVSNDLFGWSVAIDGDYIVVGAWGKSEYLYRWGWLHESGAAYVFKRSGADWVEQSKLTRAYGAWWNQDAGYDAGYRFGYSVDIDDPYLIIGAEGQHGPEVFTPGAAYVFNRQGETWTIQGTLTAAEPQDQDYFGSSVAIDDDYAVVGAPGEYGWTDPPAAYVFERNGGIWTLNSSLASGETTVDDQFGTSVALDSGYAVVGAPGAYGNTDYPGAAYAYSIYQVDICADDEEIVYGGSTTLSWNFIGAISVTIDNGIGEVFQSGSIAVSPTGTTTYTITATGPWGTYTDTVTVTVEPFGLFIDSPWDNDTILKPDVNVQGRIVNPHGLEIGLTV
ncbi:MAG: hypothetical protein JW896_06725, partial [Deltaproteobacteria bacterium]|nr:hypothetical protein [Deltaproteobacteria bacterium]